MKKILSILFLLSVLFYGCDKDTSSEDMSTITYFVTFELEGDLTMSIPVGEGYTEPGYTAMEGEENVTENVVIDGAVDADAPGVYTLTYSAVNQDGFSASTERTVVVYDPAAPDTDLTGDWEGSREGRGGGLTTIEKIAPGIFLASDMFGGYYEYIAGYGSAYRLTTYFMLNDDNTITSLSNTSPWGPWEILDGVYNPATDVITHTVEQDGFQFNVTMTKQ